MIPADAGERSRIFGRFDPASQWTIKRCFFKLGVIAVFAIGIIQRPVANSVFVLAYANFMFCLVFAILLRERWANGALNHWDEAVTYAALGALAHQMMRVAG